jgi:hypothetical protein
LGGCIIGSVQRERLREALEIPSRYEILLVIALGKPKETVIIEAVGADGDIKYWRDEEGRHHVPKRALDEIIVSWSRIAEDGMVLATSQADFCTRDDRRCSVLCFLRSTDGTEFSFRSTQQLTKISLTLE